MIWALLFGFIISITNGGSSQLLPQSEHLVAKYVQGEERKKELLILIKEAQSERKLLWEETTLFNKKYNRLLLSRDARIEDFDNLIHAYHLKRRKAQEFNLDLALKSQNLITEKEWNEMKGDFKREVKKLDQELVIAEESILKQLLKLKKRVNRHVPNKQELEVIINQISDFEERLSSIFQTYQEEVHNDKGILYQHSVAKEELKEMQDTHSFLLNEILINYRDLHRSIVDHTNEKEWKKIRKTLRTSF